MKHTLSHILLACIFICTTSACHNDAQSNVPDYPVCLDVDIQNEYPHFVPANPCQSITFYKARYMQEAIGYGGVVVWININGEYLAADLCCPHCLLRSKPIQVNGMDAQCPTCGECFDLTTYGFPIKGVADQPLKQYGISISGYKLRIRN